MADTPYGPFGTVLVGGVTELYHYRGGTWESVGRFDSPTGVDALKVDTLDVTQDGIYDFVITMDDLGAMRPIGGVLVQRSDGGWYWADFQDPVDASYTPVRDGLRVLDGAPGVDRESVQPRLRVRRRSYLRMEHVQRRTGLLPCNLTGRQHHSGQLDRSQSPPPRTGGSDPSALTESSHANDSGTDIPPRG